MTAPPVLAALALAFAVALPLEAADFSLVEDGRPACTIVVAAPVAAELLAAAGSPQTQPAAGGEARAPSNAAAATRELQHYLRRISGATLPIVGDDRPVTGRRVLVGRSKLTDAIQGLGIPGGVTADLRDEGFVVRCEGDTLVLAGNDDGPYYGTRYAVCELLERLGVRWVMPGEFGEVVPRQKTIAVGAMSVVQRPSFALRASIDDPEWQVHNKLNSRIVQWAGVVGDNTLAGSGDHGYLGGPDVFKAHPEWFALEQDGKTRSPRMVCMTSRGAIRHVAEKCKAEARAGKGPAYGMPYSTFAPDDGEPRCYCPECQKLSLGLNAMISDERNTRPGGFAISQEWFHFVGEVLKEVNAEFPRWRVATNGYANRDTPPALGEGFNREKNLVVMYANIYACTLHAWDDPHCWQNARQGQHIRRWCELSDKVWLYQYNYTMLAGKGTPTPTLTRIARNTKLAKRWGVWGFAEENVDNRLCNGVMERYLRAKLYWDADADADALLDDLCEKWYGAAAKPVRAIYAALDEAFATTTQHGHEEPILPPVYAPELMATLDRRIREAEALARPGDEARRVEVERLIYDHLRGYVALEKAKREGDYRAALRHIDAMMTLRERMRAISPFILSRHPAHAGGLPTYGDIVWEKPVLEKRLAQLEGAEGRLVAFLPERARFRTDPHDDGYYERWYAAGLDDGGWPTISTAAGWESQGLPGMIDERGFGYKGAAWYRMSVDVPAAERGGRVVLVCPSVVNRALLWVNGRFAGASDLKNPWFRPSPAEFDVSAQLEPGKHNQITLRVFCNETAWGAGGIYERMYLYVQRP